MREQLVVEGCEGVGRLVGQVVRQPLGERVELAVAVAGLRDAVGVEQQLILVGEVQCLQTGVSPVRARSPSGGDGQAGSTATTAESRTSSGGA